jgi:hypothetical protein
MESDRRIPIGLVEVIHRASYGFNVGFNSAFNAFSSLLAAAAFSVGQYRNEHRCVMYSWQAAFASLGCAIRFSPMN